MTHLLNKLDPCGHYITLSDPTRSINTGFDYKCDNNLKNVWYRFNGGPNVQMMPQQVISQNKCGTELTGWLTRRHPTGKCLCFHHGIVSDVIDRRSTRDQCISN